MNAVIVPQSPNSEDETRDLSGEFESENQEAAGVQERLRDESEAAIDLDEIEAAEAEEKGLEAWQKYSYRANSESENDRMQAEVYAAHERTLNAHAAAREAGLAAETEDKEQSSQPGQSDEIISQAYNFMDDPWLQLT